MKRQIVQSGWWVLAAALVLSVGVSGQVWAASETQEQERIYGSQLMTEQERTEYRSKIRAAKTVEEREQIRKEHHERMKARAAERGMTLPDEPPPMGGMGPGMGPGPGGRKP